MLLESLVALVWVLYVLGAFMSFSIASEDRMPLRQVGLFTAFWPIWAVVIITIGMVYLYRDVRTKSL